MADFLSSSAIDHPTAVEAALREPAGWLLRDEMARNVARYLPMELVPAVYAEWRPLVHDAIVFILSRLSAARLAPKLVEQMALPPETAPEERLLRLLARMPGLQKLGQVVARNRHLHASLRNALSTLENGISDASYQDIHSTIVAELGPALRTYRVKIESAIWREASVSAVVRFTWRNRTSGQDEKGVFKILKPHVPACFSEDTELLQRLARFVESKGSAYALKAHAASETFSEVRQLLEHEIDFVREQRMLLEAGRLYGSLPGVRTPGLIQPLCTSKITATTEEGGEKVTDAVQDMPQWRRSPLAEQLVEALIAVPLLSSGEATIFHADPHAGNLLYDRGRRELVILDWALTERLSREQRRHLAVLLAMVALRDPAGICKQIQALTCKKSQKMVPIIEHCVSGFLGELPPSAFPGVADATRLLERLALEGVIFPAALLMLRKVLFTLDGILHEIAGPDFSVDPILFRTAMQRWIWNPTTFGSPLLPVDWLSVQVSAVLYPSRWWAQWMWRLSTAGSARLASLPDRVHT
ncbi:MAG TPA: AarF/UbiB family protein [Terriglobales bacterium]|jgi:ubiquinone biosynthesis protein|nr:AarF/UbiB family protein [Terriglobales bacterium]